jgi:glycosyltransferase involved in cell wall biosynthesis
MRLGLIARADARGLGIQTKAVHDNLHPVKTMVIDCPSAKPLPLRRDWFPDATWVHGLPTHGDFRTWLDGLDVVYTAETGYGTALWDEAERAGVKTVLAVNPEFLDRHDRPSLWAAPSMWRYDQLPEPKCFLPVPITPAECQETAGRTATRFVHVVGRPATRDRNGSEDLLASLQYVTTPVRVTITCQEAGYVENLVGRFSVPSNVELVVRSGDVQCNTDLYEGQEVLLMPRRFGGLCLPLNEALGAGLPVVMPAISPNNTWLPSDWLVPATQAGSFTVKQNVIDFYSVDHQAYAEKIDALAGDPGLYTKAKTEALELREQYSWDTLRPAYLRTLQELS